MKIQFVLSTVNKKLYEKSIQEGLNDYSLIDNKISKPKEENYKTFNEYFQDLSNYIYLKFRYTYGSKEKKKTQ